MNGTTKNLRPTDGDRDDDPIDQMPLSFAADLDEEISGAGGEWDEGQEYADAIGRTMFDTLGAVVEGPFAEPDDLKADAPIVVTTTVRGATFMPRYHGRIQVEILGEEIDGILVPRASGPFRIARYSP